MGNTGNKRRYLLDIFVKIRTVNSLDKAVSRNIAYQDTIKRQDKAFNKLDMAGLSKNRMLLLTKRFQPPTIVAQHIMYPLAGVAGRNKACV